MQNAHRQNVNQTPYSELSEEIANAELTQENYELLLNRKQCIIPNNELELFQHAKHLYPECAKEDYYNEK